MKLRIFVLTIIVVATWATPVGATGINEGSESKASVQAEPSCNQNDIPMPTSRNEFLNALRRINGSSAFGSYSEFELIRSQSVLLVQAGSFEADKQRRTEIVLGILRQFRRARACRAEGRYSDALAAANQTAETAAQFETPSGQRLGALVELALTRFYNRLGEDELKQAEAADRTPTRIVRLAQAAIAFRQGESTDRFSTVSVRLDRTQQEFQSDIEQINSSTMAAKSFLNNCQSCNAPITALRIHGASVFTMYEEAQQQRQSVVQGRQLASEHGLKERVNETQAIEQRLQTRISTLSVAGGLAILGPTIVVGLVAALVANRLSVWRQDYEDAQAGDIVLTGEMLNE